MPQLWTYVLHPLVIAVFCFSAQIIHAAELPSIKEIVDKFDTAQANVETLQAPCTLSIKRAMLQAPAVTKGTLYLSGSDFAHFAFAPPVNLVMHVTGKELVSYLPMEKKGEVLKIPTAKKINRKQLRLSQNIPYWTDFFKLEASAPADIPGTIMVTLRPRSISLKKKVDVIQVWVDKETWLLKGLKWVERGGDTWHLELGTIQANAVIPASIKDFAMPPGTSTDKGFSFFKERKK